MYMIVHEQYHNLNSLNHEQLVPSPLLIRASSSCKNAAALACEAKV